MQDKESLYKLKQTPRIWYNRMKNFLMSLGFTKSKADSNIYFKVEGERPVMLLLYVDDLFLKGKEELFKDARMRFATGFKMKYLGIMHYLIGMEVWNNANDIFLGQGNYAVELLKKFKILDRKAITTPMESNLKLFCDASLETVDAMIYHQMIGSLMYLMNTRLDICCFVVNTLS